MLRRRFLVTTLSGVSSLAMSAKSYSQIVGANQRVRLALIGCGGRGFGVVILMRNPRQVRSAQVDLKSFSCKTRG